MLLNGKSLKKLLGEKQAATQPVVYAKEQKDQSFEEALQAFKTKSTYSTVLFTLSESASKAALQASRKQVSADSSGEAYFIFVELDHPIFRADPVI
jgi:hypothetical protein